MKKGLVKRETQRSSLKDRVGSYFTVRGMWMGDFLGKLTEVDLCNCRMDVVKGFSGNPPLGENISIPFGSFVEFTGPTDKERQMEISDVAPDITI